MNSAVLTFHGRVGDANDLAMRGSAIVGAALGRRLGVPAEPVGTPEPALAADWRTELAAADGALTVIADAVEHVFERGAAPVLALTRCAVAIGTVPVVVKRRPDVCVVWFDAHADVHTPASTTSGYLGGMALSGPMGWWDSGHGGGLAVGNVVLAGVRDADPGEALLIAEREVRTVGVGPDLPDRLRAAVAGRPVYWHIDCDVLDPGIVPTEYSVPDGLTLADLRAAAEVLAESEVVGLEIAEFQDTDPAPSADALVESLDPVLDRLSRNDG